MAPGASTAFVRFLLCGGGVGVVAMTIPSNGVRRNPDSSPTVAKRHSMLSTLSGSTLVAKSIAGVAMRSIATVLVRTAAQLLRSVSTAIRRHDPGMCCVFPD